MMAAAAGAAYGSYAALVGMAVEGVMLAGAGYSAYSSYEQGKAQEQQMKAQAAENQYQAKLENERAGIAQLQGEREAEKRSRQLAQAIGSTYANYAGNGLLVDGSTKDTLGDVLTAQVGEGVSDITTIRDNAAMQVWGHQANAASLIASGANNLTAGRNARRTGALTATGTAIGGVGSVGTSALTMYGMRQKT